MITNIYIDGFNLYYGSLRNYPQFKWLDLSKLCHALLPGSQIHRIRYFAAPVSAFPYDPQAPDRQAIYLRALRTVPNLTVHLGRFSIRPARMPRYPLSYTPGHSRPESVSVQIKSINRKVLANSQFPRVLSDAKGEFRRPDVWS